MNCGASVTLPGKRSAFYRESKQPISVSISELLQSVLTLQQRALQDNRIKLRKPDLFFVLCAGISGRASANLPEPDRQFHPGHAKRRRSQCARAPGDRLDHAAARSRLFRSSTPERESRPQDAPRIFQPFFSTKSTKGTGLGLWISKGIVQKYNGRIAFRTYRHAGRCTTCFRVFLPGTGMSGAGSLAADETGSVPYALSSTSRGKLQLTQLFS